MNIGQILLDFLQIGIKSADEAVQVYSLTSLDGANLPFIKYEVAHLMPVSDSFRVRIKIYCEKNDQIKYYLLLEKINKDYIVSCNFKNSLEKEDGNFIVSKYSSIQTIEEKDNLIIFQDYDVIGSKV